MKRYLDANETTSKHRKYNASIVEMEELFDFDHILQKKCESGHGGRILPSNNESTVSLSSANTNDERLIGLGLVLNLNLISQFGYLDLDYDFDLPAVNLESDLKLMDQLFYFDI